MLPIVLHRLGVCWSNRVGCKKRWSIMTVPARPTNCSIQRHKTWQRPTTTLPLCYKSKANATKPSNCSGGHASSKNHSTPIPSMPPPPTATSGWSSWNNPNTSMPMSCSARHDASKNDSHQTDSTSPSHSPTWENYSITNINNNINNHHHRHHHLCWIGVSNSTREHKKFENNWHRIHFLWPLSFEMWPTYGVTRTNYSKHENFSIRHWPYNNESLPIPWM
mmetsp:Transcript_18663/g.31883  ORF Transcript_18663/g.31883 Transcript_18663/m.31883 type:complete len:221 (-) Transcript_18663:8-670(-)